MPRLPVYLYEKRTDAGSHGEENQRSEASERVRVLSYNVLGARQGLSKKHGHVGVDVSVAHKGAAPVIWVVGATRFLRVETYSVKPRACSFSLGFQLRT